MQQEDAVSSAKPGSERLVCSYLHAHEIVSATSAGPLWIFVALRTYLCERPSSSFRPLSFCLRSLFLPFLLFFFFFLYHNRGGRFYLRAFQMIRFDQSIFRKLLSRDASLPGEFLLYVANHIQMSKFIFVPARERKLHRFYFQQNSLISLRV